MQGTNNNPNTPLNNQQPMVHVDGDHSTHQTEQSGKPIHTDQEKPLPKMDEGGEKKPSDIKDKGFKAFMGGFSAMIKGALNLPEKLVHGKETYDHETYKGIAKDIGKGRGGATIGEAKQFLKDNKVASGLGKALGTIPALGLGLVAGILSAPFVGIKMGMDRYKQYKTDQKDLKGPRQDAVKEFHDAKLGFIDPKYAEKKINKSKEPLKTLSELKSLNERKADAFSQIPKDWNQSYAKERLINSKNPEKTLQNMDREVKSVGGNGIPKEKAEQKKEAWNLLKHNGIVDSEKEKGGIPALQKRITTALDPMAVAQRIIEERKPPTIEQTIVENPEQKLPQEQLRALKNQAWQSLLDNKIMTMDTPNEKIEELKVRIGNSDDPIAEGKKIIEEHTRPPTEEKVTIEEKIESPKTSKTEIKDEKVSDKPINKENVVQSKPEPQKKDPKSEAFDLLSKAQIIRDVEDGLMLGKIMAESKDPVGDIKKIIEERKGTGGTEKNENIQKNQPEIRTTATNEQKQEAMNFLNKNGIQRLENNQQKLVVIQNRIKSAPNPMAMAKEILKEYGINISENKQILENVVQSKPEPQKKDPKSEAFELLSKAQIIRDVEDGLMLGKIMAESKDPVGDIKKIIEERQSKDFGFQLKALGENSKQIKEFISDQATLGDKIKENNIKLKNLENKGDTQEVNSEKENLIKENQQLQSRKDELGVQQTKYNKEKDKLLDNLSQIFKTALENNDEKTINLAMSTIEKELSTMKFADTRGKNLATKLISVCLNHGSQNMCKSMAENKEFIKLNSDLNNVMKKNKIEAKALNQYEKSPETLKLSPKDEKNYKSALEIRKQLSAFVLNNVTNHLKDGSKNSGLMIKLMQLTNEMEKKDDKKIKKEHTGVIDLFNRAIGFSIAEFTYNKNNKPKEYKTQEERVEAANKKNDFKSNFSQAITMSPQRAVSRNDPSAMPLINFIDNYKFEK